MGCTAVFDTDRNQCSVDEDCVSPDGTELMCSNGVCQEADRLGCLGSFTPSDDDVLEVNFRLRSLFTLEPITGTVRVCPSVDADCSNPTIDSTPVPLDGVTLSVPRVLALANFYLEVTPDDTVFLPLLISFDQLWLKSREFRTSQPVLFDGDGAIWVDLVERETFRSLVEGLDGTVVDTDGQIFTNAVTCRGDTLVGARFMLSRLGPMTFAWFLENGLPSNTAGRLTDPGLAGFINAPPGQVEMFVTDEQRASVVGSFTMIIRAGWVSRWDFLPSES